MTDLKQPVANTTSRLHGLDHLRALAIILVFFFHYRLFGHPKWVQKVGYFGWAGVDLFFVLSGYLIASQLFETIAQKKKVLLKQFYFKRLMRTIPAYLAVLAVYFLVPSFREKEALPPLWKFLTFTQNFGIDVKNYGTFSHAWSLCIEEQFYLFFPIVAAILFYMKAGKKSILLLIAIFIIGIILRGYCWTKFVSPFVSTDNYAAEWARWIYYPTYTRLDALLAGIAIAAVYNFYPNIKEYFSKHGNFLLIICLLFFWGAYLTSINQFSIVLPLFSFPLVALGFGALVMAAISPAGILYKMNSVITRVIATLSYSIYLTHKGLIHITQTVFTKYGVAPKGYLMLFLCIVVSLAGALILHIAVEKPFLTIRNNLLKKKTATPAL